MIANSVKLEKPAGPPPSFIGGNLIPMRRDSLAFLMSNQRDYGAITYLELGPFTVYQVNDPDLIQQVLVKKANSFRKSIIYKKTLAEYLGNGLLISDGDFWRRQRRLAQPAFHTNRISTYAMYMTELTTDMLNDWQAGETRDIATEMMELTLNIVGKTIFDTDLSNDSGKIGEAVEILLHNVIEASRTIITLPEWIPTPARRRKKHAIELLDEVMDRLIQERRADPTDRGDLLSMLMLAEDEDGTRMSDKEVRDEALTIVLAGHETTANALTWTLYLLSENPDIEARLYDEVNSVLGNRTPTLDDLKNLTYTEQVLKESMRLYPPAWSVGRQVIEDVEIGDYVLPKNAGIIIAAYSVHRNPDLWEEPEKFDPERWTPEREATYHRYAYLPFGGGPRICIGNSFAMMEARLILAGIIQRYRLTLKPGHKVIPEPLITLRPKHGMPMELHAR